VISSKTEQAVELFVRREDAEEVVSNWRRDEPDDAEALCDRARRGLTWDSVRWRPEVGASSEGSLNVSRSARAFACLSATEADRPHSEIAAPIEPSPKLCMSVLLNPHLRACGACALRRRITRAAAARRDYGPSEAGTGSILTHLATDGTPSCVTMKSM
jgi:hypothetical protein